MTSAMEKKVLKANIVYHSALSKINYQDQPHFLPENVARVDAILEKLATKTAGNRLLDLGCGTGFVINIAKKHFKEIVGIDITPDMLKLVDTSGGQIKLYEANTNDLSFLEAESFDVCTGYSFLHHLVNFEPTLRQAYRCLRPGGIMYFDQDPNRHYWKLTNDLQDNKDLPEIIQKEVRSVTNSFEDAIIGTDLSVEDVSLAEFHDISKGGIDADELVALLNEIGFKKIDFRYEWYLGQGRVLHQQSPEESEVIETYLRGILPVSRQLFKYMSFQAEK